LVDGPEPFIGDGIGLGILAKVGMDVLVAEGLDALANYLEAEVKKTSSSVPKHKKKVASSQEGEKVRTPDTHPDDFGPRDSDGRTKNKHTKEEWEKSNIPDASQKTHKGEKWKVFNRKNEKVGQVKEDGTVLQWK